jgi:hypothetical protein
MYSEQLEQQEMEKLANAASLVKELAEGHGIDVDNITEEEAQNLLGMAYEALHGPAEEEGEKTASIIIHELSQSEEGMQKLAAAGEVGEGLLEEEGINIEDLTEEQASEVLLHVLNNYEFVDEEEEEKTASLIVEELSETEEGMAKLAYAGQVASETLGEEGISPDDLTEEQAAELLIGILMDDQEEEEKTAALQEDLEKIAALRQAGAIMYSGFADELEKDAGVREIMQTLKALLASGGSKAAAGGRKAVAGGRIVGGKGKKAASDLLYRLTGHGKMGQHMRGAAKHMRGVAKRHRTSLIAGGAGAAGMGAGGGAGYLVGKRK